MSSWGYGKWRQLEELLDSRIINNGSLEFTNRGLARVLGISRENASSLIQAYQNEMRRSDSMAEYIIYRQGRTYNARWFAGKKSYHAKRIREQFVDDQSCRIERALFRDIDQITRLNPETLTANNISKAKIRMALETLRLAANGIGQ